MKRRTTQDATGAALAPTIGLRLGDAAWGDLMRRRGCDDPHKGPSNTCAFCAKRYGPLCADKIPPWTHIQQIHGHTISPVADTLSRPAVTASTIIGIRV